MILTTPLVILSTYAISAFSAAAVAVTPVTTNTQCVNKPAANKIMTIVFENEDQTNVLDDLYFGVILKPKSYYLSNMHGVWHPSQPNYIGMISGSIQWTLGDWDVNIDAKSIVDLLEPKGLTWKSYQEDYTGICNTASTIGKYARKHNPFISFKNVQNSTARCSNIVSSAQLDVDAKAGKLPNYMFFTPNLNNDGHNTNTSTASAWLQTFLEPKLEDPAYADVLFIVTFDESSCYLCNNNIYTALIGAGVTAGTVDNNSYNHYSVLATIEKNWNLGNLGTGDKDASTIPLNFGVCY